MSRERGQASVEWIAVVGVVVAVLLAAAAGAVPGAAAIPRAVEAGFARAFCLVGGGDCLDGAPRPCVVRADERSRQRRATAVVVRLADGRTVVREERSDGTVVLTVEDGARAGVSLSMGARVKLGPVRAAAEGSVGAQGGAAYGRRYELKSSAAADAVLARLRDESPGAPALARRVGGGGHPEGLLAPDEQWWSVTGDGDAEASLRALGLAAQLGLARRYVAGVRARETGERTVVLEMDDGLAAELGAPLVRLDAGLSHVRTVELEFDARRRLSFLTVRGARGANGNARLGPLRAGGGDLVEGEARLDLADPVARGHASALLDALRDVAPGRAVTAARALGERLADRARVDLRLYATTRDVRVSGLTVGFLGQLGYEVEDVHATARLVDAIGREPGMGWTRRFDCVGLA
ncbi:MAG TPA: hypothetical protein VHF89_10700 [Solirubrobacteraceae bacterium]|nr:hypothetical protein [Solirubrobacteraceae bacterium]